MIYLYWNWRDRENYFVCCVCIDDSPLFDSFVLRLCVSELSVQMNEYTHAHAHIHTRLWAHRLTSFVLYTFAYTHSTFNGCAILGTKLNDYYVWCAVSLSFPLSHSFPRLLCDSLSFLIKSNGNYFNFWPNKNKLFQTKREMAKKQHSKELLWHTDCFPDFYVYVCVLWVQFFCILNCVCWLYKNNCT